MPLPSVQQHLLRNRRLSHRPSLQAKHRRRASAVVRAVRLGGSAATVSSAARRATWSSSHLNDSVTRQRSRCHGHSWHRPASARRLRSNCRISRVGSAESCSPLSRHFVVSRRSRVLVRSVLSSAEASGTGGEGARGRQGDAAPELDSAALRTEWWVLSR